MVGNIHFELLVPEQFSCDDIDAPPFPLCSGQIKPHGGELRTQDGSAGIPYTC